MPDENGMLRDMDFETKLNDLGDDQPDLIRFIARQQFATGKILVSHGRRIKSLESRNKRLFGVVGGAGAILATLVIGVIEYFTRKGS